ncbi:MAG: site-specific DNA-methyltransferase [Anaerolinea sp.]|nr:site-specific DNA-methyltransferase [Anaerolinea sp.]
MDNCLYYGDNLDILRRYIKDESIDLIYLDPPFNSKANYNMLFKEHDGQQSIAQFQAFEDTWTWDQVSAKTYQEVVESGGKVSQALLACRTLLGDTDMLAYLTMMSIRLIELRRVLKSTGCIFLHCDPTASHYLKVIMDAIFGPLNFINDIVWERYSRPKGSQFKSRKFGVSTDNLLFYAKTTSYNFFLEDIEPELSEDGISKRYTLEDDKGHYYSGPLLRSASMGYRPNLVFEFKGYTPGPEGWRMTKEKLIELEKNGDIFFTGNGTPRRKVRLTNQPGSPITNCWTDIQAIGSQAKERLGYPTQKPEALLERIIKVSCKEGDVVLDPFCGCGTAVVTAQKLNRQWIGIDITHLAITVVKQRLKDAFGGVAKFKVIGEPTSLPDAEELAASDPYQFQWWVLGFVGARPVEGKKGADQGIDGRLYFHEQDGGETKQVIFSVKAGNTNAAHIRDLHGVIDREGAAIGVLLTMQEPTKPMRSEAASGGIYTSPWGNHPKLQILTVEELLEGKKIDMPPVHQVNITYKRASKSVKKGGNQPDLLTFKGD